jgi:hypothetical protein
MNRGLALVLFNLPEMEKYKEATLRLGVGGGNKLKKSLPIS